MAGDRNNATSSWSGYNHQGQVGIFLALNEMCCIYNSCAPQQMEDYSIQFEIEDGEDIDIVNGKTIISRHQVKAKKNKKYPNSYKDVLTKFKIQGVPKDSRYLHTICEVIGFDLSKKEFSKLKNKPDYVSNVCGVKLYQYPDGNKYCELNVNNGTSKIDGFCITKIKELLIKSNHQLQNDTDHIKETLFELKDLLCTKVREAHDKGNKAYPKITFKEIYDIVTSTKKRENQAIRRAKTLFEIYWNNLVDENVNCDLFNKIINLSNEQFEIFLIDLHPQKSIKILKETYTIDSLLDEDAFEEIFYEFYKQINQESFDISDLTYKSMLSSYRLSMINKKCKHAEVRYLVQSIWNNRQFLKASFDVDYLVNGRINSPFFELDQLYDNIEFQYTNPPSKCDSLFSSNLEFIDIDQTKFKLSEERDG